MNDEDNNPPFHEAAYRILVCSSFDDLLWTVKDSIKGICYVCDDEFDKLQYDTIKSTLRLIQDDLEDGGDSDRNIKDCLSEWGSNVKTLKSKIKTLRQEHQFYRAACKETVLLIQENAYVTLLVISKSRHIS